MVVAFKQRHYIMLLFKHRQYGEREREIETAVVEMSALYCADVLTLAMLVAC